MENYNSEYKEENSVKNEERVNIDIKTSDKQNKNQNQIAGAIIIAGILIAGAILLKENNYSNIQKDTSISKKVGLNKKSFDSCLLSEKFKDKIQAQINDGTEAGVNGTPSSFILKNGIVVDTIEGAQPIEIVTEKIKNTLEKNTEPMVVKIKPVSQDDHILGDVNAKIVIIEYSDLECPFCKIFHETMHQIVENNNGDVAWVYRHYPILQLHPKAFRQALATECAFEQKGNEGFWKYTDELFRATQSNNTFDETKL